jgi:hypothetical protein
MRQAATAGSNERRHELGEGEPMGDLLVIEFPEVKHLVVPSL